MRVQVERLQKLTLDLLDLSKLDADAMEIRRERVDLKQLAREVAGEFRPAAHERTTPSSRSGAAGRPPRSPTPTGSARSSVS